MTGIEALNELIAEGTNDNNIDIGPSNCPCNNCRTCWYRIIRAEIKEKEPDVNVQQMQVALMIQSLDMQKFLGLYTQGMLATFHQFIGDFLESITKEDKEKLIKLSIEKLEMSAIEDRDKILKKIDRNPL